ncbi:MAG: CYTH domain-containing protein [Rickettsiales bacterium]|jgi:adenylate cyclase class 2|nr:CYTH domain-containing protein [Rickettsiales bacterium]
MKTEIEIKFYPVDKDDARTRFARAGFRLASPEFMMTRSTFDLSHIGKWTWGRVRREHDRITMSIKRVSDNDSITGTSESQVVIDSFEGGGAFMEAAGFQPKSFQETLREIWTRGSVEATIDTWPGLEPFVEIEGESEELVKGAAADLGFDMSDALFGATDTIYKKFFGIPFEVVNAWPEITFANPPKIT